jgi:hypothetical protein
MLHGMQPTTFNSVLESGREVANYNGVGGKSKQQKNKELANE